MLELHLADCGTRSSHQLSASVSGVPIICMLLKCTLHPPSTCSLYRMPSYQHMHALRSTGVPKVIMKACTAR